MDTRDERGAAMMTVLIILTVVGLLGVVSTQVARSTVAQSGENRARVTAVHAAEAGINHALDQLAAAAGSTWCGTAAPVALPGSADAPGGGQTYAITVTDSDPSDGACTATDPIRLVRATGSSPAGGSTQGVRVMEAQVRLEPNQSTGSGDFSFNDAIFSAAPDNLIVASGININGDGGDNADIYNGHTGATTNKIDGAAKIRGDVVVRSGLVLGGSAHVYGDVWAPGNIRLEGDARVFGNVVSSGGSITFAGSARTTGYARAATTVTKSGTAGADGAFLPNSPGAAPPARTLPAPPPSWPAPGWPLPYKTFATCDAFDKHLLEYWPVEPSATNRANFKGTYHIKQAGCAATMPGGGQVITLTGDAAIVADGCIAFGGSGRLTRPSGSTASLVLASLSTTSCGWASEGVKLDGGYNVREIPTLIYARNKATVAGSVVVTGQIYGEKVSVSGGFHLDFKQVSAPGFVDPNPVPTTEGFTPQLQYLRQAT